MTPEETALLTEELEHVITADEIAEVLPLTQGDGSVYRKDEETGKVNHEKVSTGAETARVNFKMTMPKLQGPNFASFMEAAKNFATSSPPPKIVKTYSDEAIERVKTGGIIGDIANKIVKKQHGER